MLGIFKGLTQRPLEATAAALFVTVARQASSRDGGTLNVSLQKVSSIIDIGIPKIALMMKILQKKKIVDQLGTGAITDVSGAIRAALPDFELRDPVSGADINDQVISLTGKIIQLIQRRSSSSMHPNFLTLAASHLAYKSCCYQQVSFRIKI